ncbi:MAG TPA: hypothetical protein DCY42_13860 [Chloroflexi bacterium]|nr:hypothetical protein [Chloroflexota bacterium]
MSRTNISLILIGIFVILFLFLGCDIAGNLDYSQWIAISNVNLVPMTEEVILENQTVLINEAQIAEIGSSEDIKIPKNAVIIDGAGFYLMPGLADMHMHSTQDWETDWPVSPFALYLANGVTTVRNLDPLPGNSSTPTMNQADYALVWRDDILTQNRPGPMMYLAGISLQGPDDWRPIVLEAGDAEKVVQANADKGYDFLKMFEYFPSEYFAEAMAAADQYGLYVTGHIPMAVGLENAVNGGLDEIAHIIPILMWERVGGYTPGMTRNEFLQHWQTETITQWNGGSSEEWYQQQQESIDRIVEIISSNDVVVCTTVSGPDITKELISDYDAFIQRTDMQYSRGRFLDLISRGEDGAQKAFTQNPSLMESFIYERDIWLRELKDAGVQLILGTDSGFGMGIVPGFSAHLELQAMVNIGFTPYEAIATGTVNASNVVEQMIGVDEFGTIEVGKRADFILIGGNPLDDVANIQEILGVMAAGRWYPRESLDELLTLP